MLKVIVFSDSHGDVNHMAAAVEQEEPDLVLHLGDYWEDARELSWIYPELTTNRCPATADLGV